METNVPGKNHPEMPTEKGVLPFFIDRTREIAIGEGPFVYNETLLDNTLTVLTHLTKKPNPRVIIDGEPGQGRHTLLRSIAIGSKQDKYPGLARKRLIEIDPRSITENMPPDQQEKLRELFTGTYADSFFYVDLTGLSQQEISAVSRLNWPIPLMVLGNPRVFKDRDMWDDRWDQINLKSYSQEEREEIVRKHYRFRLQKDQLQGGDEKKILDLLLSYGRGITQKAQPGAAIELLQLTAAAVKLSGGKILGTNQIVELMARQGNISAESLLKDDVNKIRDLQEAFQARIIGQDEAKQHILRALRRKAVSLSEDKRPIGSFIFLGPTGVGKTETARVLAEALFGSQENMIQIDMSEYQESHSVARLIGSPPGYVGYDNGGFLTEAVSKNPFSVVLLDEIDKASPNVSDTFLQVFEDGRLTDGKGKTVDFRQTIVVMTSNFMSDFFYDAVSQGRDPDEVAQIILNEFKNTMRPELINRLDGIVIYKPLDKADGAKVLDLLIDKTVCQQLKDERNIEIEVDGEAREYLLNLGFDPKLGARPLKRIVERVLLDEIAEGIIGGTIQNGDNLLVVVDDGKISIKSKPTT